ncbi:sulfurtransferase complex subunit TusC [Aliivibrio kagoshimensis]|uniref:sulfurtransferase complex subunit TusC n=1 Tax=Aliivibrio kagoshimensis TaxID=2910230 RepID=UPI003D0ABFCC
MSKLGFIFNSAPHGSSSGREGLDALLAASAYTDNIRVLFVNDGVYQLLSKQQPELIQSRDYISTFKMLGLYEVDDIYACKASLMARQIDEKQLIIEANSVSAIEIQQLIDECDNVLVF